MNSMIFETSRLLVRPLRLDDFPTYFEMQGNPSIHKYTGSQVDDEATARAGLEKHIRCYSEPENGWWIWCVERKSDGVMVGTCAVIYSGNDIVGEGPEIGYRFLEKHWGNGYAAEICDPLIDHSLNTMKLPSVFATVDVLNVASVKTLERSKLNFVAEYFNEKENCTDRVYFLRR